MQAPLTSRQIVELFHLIFIRALFANTPDKSLIAVKGGINLRFFFNSPRFSEDLDLDVVTMSKETLENRVDRLLKSPAIVAVLKSRGVLIKEVSKPKQTDTVQRWKCSVATVDASTEERTKIEFSRRDDVAAARFEAVESAISIANSMPTFLANHYRCPEAVQQKIHALEGRSEAQPRDVFDLHILFARPDAPTTLDAEARTWTVKAAEKVAGLTYEAYVALVVAYLEPGQADIYSSRETWEAMQVDVVERILALA